MLKLHGVEHVTGNGIGETCAVTVPETTDVPTAAEHVSTPLAVPVSDVIANVNVVDAAVLAMFPV